MDFREKHLGLNYDYKTPQRPDGNMLVLPGIGKGTKRPNHVNITNGPDLSNSKQVDDYGRQSGNKAQQSIQLMTDGG